MEEWGNEEGGGGDGRGKRENGRGWGELGERGVWGRWGVGMREPWMPSVAGTGSRIEIHS